MSQTILFNPFDPQFIANPHAFYAWLRETAPIQHATLPNGQPLWLVTRYADVEAAFSDPRLVKEPERVRTPEALARMPIGPEVLQYLNYNMLARDPPDHTRLKRLVSKVFTPRMVEQMRPRIQAIADTLLDAVVGHGEMDVIEAYAFPLPIIVIAEMLGVPPVDRDNFRRWSATILSAPPPMTPGAEVFEAAQALLNFMEALFEERRRAPADDLITGLVEAEEAGNKLSKQELQGMVFLLLSAGHETTANLIGNGTLALLEHPDQLAKLRDDATLLTSAVEELLRFCAPVATSTLRYASEDIPLRGTVIPKGDTVLVVIAAANRDPERFSSPDRLDITRADNKHLAFGTGTHFCLGAGLARLEGAIALETLLRRMPRLRLGVAPEALNWHPSMLLRGLVKLPVVF